MVLLEAIQFFIEARTGIVANKTLRINRQYLLSLAQRLGSDKLMASVTLDDLRAWRKWLVEREEKYATSPVRKTERAKLSRYTVHGHVRVCKQFFKWFYLEGKLASNPAARLEQVQLPRGPRRGVQENDFEKMLFVARDSPRDTALLRMFHDTGSRLNGIATLEISNIDFDQCRALVYEKGRGNQVSHFVFLKKETCTALCAWLELRSQWGPRTTRVFVSERKPHQPLTNGAVYRALKRIGKTAGVEVHTNPHAYRHGFAERALDNGAPLGAVSRWLHHSRITVTDEFYGAYETKHLQAEFNKYA